MKVSRFTITLFILLLVSLVNTAANAQKESVTELLAKAKDSKDDSARVALTLRAGKILRYSDGDSALVLLNKSLQMAKQTKQRVLQCAAMDAIADCYRIEGDYGRCIAIADSAIILALQIKANKEAGTLYQTAGVAYTEQGNVKIAADYFHKAIKYHQAAGYDKGVAMTTTNLGSLYYMGLQYKEALEWYKKALKLQTAEQDSNSIAITLTAIGQVYYDLNIMDTAEEYTLQAYAIMSRRPLLVNSLYENVLGLYDFAFERNDMAAASHWLDVADSLARSQNSEYRIARVLSCRGLIAEKQGNIPLAIQLMKESLKGIEAEGNVLMMKGTYESLYKLYVNTGDDKNALEMHVKFKMFSDSLYNTETAETVNDLNLKYETAEKEKEIIAQQQQLKEKENRLRTLYILIGSIVIIVLLLVGIIIQSRNVARQRQLAMKQEQDIALLKALVTGEEKERSRVARELHDGLGGVLAAAQMHLSTLSAEQVNDKQKLVQTEKLISSAADETRRIAHNMLPETLLRLGLDEALKEYSRTITDSKLLEVEYESMGIDSRLEASSELAIYRIIQELVNNIIKHAKASHALIQLHQHNNTLSITIEDNGHGFDTKASQKDGIGLANIKSRINFLNGSLNIKSDREKGTSVYIEIQLSK